MGARLPQFDPGVSDIDFSYFIVGGSNPLTPTTIYLLNRRSKIMLDDYYEELTVDEEEEEIYKDPDDAPVPSDEDSYEWDPD